MHTRLVGYSKQDIAEIILTKAGKPFIAVSLNYRVSAWGFISSGEVQGTGNTNLGFRDQRLALQWVQENIHAFGGDPTKVTIWGESAGAISVGAHLIAYGGRDDGLFRGAIMESGGSISANPMNTTDFQDLYDSLVLEVGCSNATDSLQCLRETPFETLNSVLNGTDGSSQYNFWPVVDGDLIRTWGSVQLTNDEFVKVPIISGTNTDEGTAFGPTGINTTQQFYEYLTGQRNPLMLLFCPNRLTDQYRRVSWNRASWFDCESHSRTVPG